MSNDLSIINEYLEESLEQTNQIDEQDESEQDESEFIKDINVGI
jgi:hypothetical protein